MNDLFTLQTLARERQEMLLKEAHTSMRLPFSFNLPALLKRVVTLLVMPVTKLFASEPSQPAEPVCCAGAVI
jgi:hypothetical protein